MTMCNLQEDYERTALYYQETEGNYKLVSTEWQINIYPDCFEREDILSKFNLFN